MRSPGPGVGQSEVPDLGCPHGHTEGRAGDPAHGTQNQVSRLLDFQLLVLLALLSGPLGRKHPLYTSGKPTKLCVSRGHAEEFGHGCA